MKLPTKSIDEPFWLDGKAAFVAGSTGDCTYRHLWPVLNGADPKNGVSPGLLNVTNGQK